MTSEKRVHLIAGLGNPGDTYKETRHNAGFMVVDAMADTYSIPVGKKKFDALIGRGQIEGHEVILAKPLSFMNLSGFPVQSIANYFRISSKDMLIIHDDIDLAFGRIKIKEKGGDGGHKGLRSLIAAFGGGEFARLRIGVGRSETRMSVPDYVLAKFDTDEIKEMEQIIIRSRMQLLQSFVKAQRKE